MNMHEFLKVKVFTFLMLWMACAVPAANAATEVVTYYHTDALGSPIATSDASGNVKWEESYTPYGSRLTQSAPDYDNEQWFTGKQEEPELGLQYFGARWYSPTMARFTTMDPKSELEGITGNTTYFNRYAYANNNPYKYMDPDGRAVETGWDILNVAIGLGSLGANIASGNWVGAAVDAAGLVYDVAATAVPGLPAGAGMYLKLGRAGDKALDVGKKVDYSRPSGYRAGVRDKVWDSAKEASTGQVRDPATGRFMSKDKAWDMGHKPGHEFRKHQQSAQERGISRKQFLDEHNNPNSYRPELPGSNRSHKGEDKTNNYFGP